MFDFSAVSRATVVRILVAIVVVALGAIFLIVAGNDGEEMATGTSPDGAVARGTDPEGTDSGYGGDSDGQSAIAGGGDADDESAEPEKVSPLVLEADSNGGLHYSADNAPAWPGRLVIDFSNSQSIAHNVRIEDPNGNDIGGTRRIVEGTERVTLKGLEPGRYVFFCSIPGHREAGMEGVLTVKWGWY